jgi:hypothetical protein
MNFLIDVCAGTAVGKWLLKGGHDVLPLKERP